MVAVWDEQTVRAFASAGRRLASLGLVRDAEGNLSTFDGDRLVITRTGARLGAIGAADLVLAGLDGEAPGASSDLEVHRRLYRDRGPGAVAHAHPPGTVPEGTPQAGAHGVYAFAADLAGAVDEAERSARGVDP